MPEEGAMKVRPITLRAANEFVQTHHRHNGPTRGWKFGIGLHLDKGKLIGVGIAGRPVARMLDDGVTAEITRVCVLPHNHNANSMIYGALIRASKALGYRSVITYTLESESGSSLKAVGFRVDGTTEGGEWSRPSRGRKASSDVGYTTEKKTRWRLDFADD